MFFLIKNVSMLNYETKLTNKNSYFTIWSLINGVNMSQIFRKFRPHPGYFNRIAWIAAIRSYPPMILKHFAFVITIKSH